MGAKINRIEKVEGGVLLHMDGTQSVMCRFNNEIQELHEVKFFTIPDGADMILIEDTATLLDDDEEYDDDGFFGVAELIDDITVDIILDAMRKPEEFILLASYQEYGDLIKQAGNDFIHETSPADRALGILGQIHGKTIFLPPMYELDPESYADYTGHIEDLKKAAQPPGNKKRYPNLLTMPVSKRVM